MISPDSLPQYLEQYGYAAVFLLSFVEGPIVTLAAAFLASQDLLSWTGVYAAVILGDLAGDSVYYAVGRWFLRRLPRLLGRRRPRLQERIEHLAARLRAHPGRILLFGKLTHSTGFLILMAAGAARVRARVFYAYSLLGTLPKSALLMTLGYFYGRFYQRLHGPFQVASAVLFAVLVAAMILVVHRWNKAFDERDEED